VAGIGDFNQLLQSSPSFASAWTEVQGHLELEAAAALPPGASGVVSAATAAASGDFSGAKIAFSDAFQQLASQSFGVGEQDAIDAAKQYVLAGQTVLGAVGTVSGLVKTLQSGAPPAAIAQTFAGTLIGAAVAVGGVSAGVGAAIVGVVGAVLSVLDSTGLLGKPTPSYQICQDFAVSTLPSFVVGCVAAYGPIVKPGSPAWRTFPREGQSGDAGWWVVKRDQFGKPLYDPGWKGAKYYAPNVGEYEKAPIEIAFPDYPTIKALPGITGAPDFATGFGAAWRVNKEYELNGLKSQEDWQVFLHFLRMWNRAHLATSGVSIAANPNGSYWEKRAADLVNNATTDVFSPSGGILVHTGGTAPVAVSPAVVAAASVHVAKADPTAVAHLITQVVSRGALLNKSAAVVALVTKVKASQSPPPAAAPTQPFVYAAAGAAAGWYFAGPFGAAAGAAAGYLFGR
jgi:hypothetical protein